MRCAAALASFSKKLLKETIRLANQLRRACYGPAWHGTPLHEILDGIPFRRAAKRPRAGQHSIWELVLHTRTWIDVVHKRMDKPARATPAQDWLAIRDLNAAGWQRDQEALWASVNALASAIEKRPDRWLETVVPGRNPQTQYISLHGLVQHLVYHAGQIAILKQ